MKINDVFISYNAQDRAFAERLAGDLVTHGLRVWWDEWELGVGDSLVEKIQDGITRSSWLAVVLSQNSVSSPWVKRELGSGLVSEIEEQRIFVLPLLLSDCTIPPLLRDKIYADFRKSYESGFEALVARLSPPISVEIAQGLMSESESRVLAAYAKVAPRRQSIYQDFLYRKLSSERSQDRISALFALYVLRAPSLASQLRSLARDSSAAVRARVALHLGQLRDLNTIRDIEVLMQDRNSAVRSAARSAFQRVTGKRP